MSSPTFLFEIEIVGYLESQRIEYHLSGSIAACCNPRLIKRENTNSSLPDVCRLSFLVDLEQRGWHPGKELNKQLSLLNDCPTMLPLRAQTELDGVLDTL